MAFPFFMFIFAPQNNKMIMKKYYFVLILTVLCLQCISISAQEGVVKTVPDKGRSGKFFAKLCPEIDVAIDKNDADVYSVYTDGATARFAQGVFRGGKYIVKAGKCVIIKTSEAKEVKYVATTEKRVSFPWDDMISPATDMSLDDFKKEYGVTEGQYIYMLTNLSRNGGFGFTHFGGKTLRAGNFYIITTRKPSGSTGVRLPIVVEGNGAVYNLKGEKVSDPTKPGIYIRNGKKYVVK